MQIIRKQLNASGAYPAIQTWGGAKPPETHYQATDSVELSNGGFGTLTIEDGVVTAFTPDVEAWKVWKMAQVEQPDPTPTPTPENIILDTLADHEYRLCLTELGVN